MKEISRIILMCVLLVAGSIPGRSEPAKVDDPAGVLKKPIPDKLIILTFDDGPLSGYTVAAPILKSHGFGGSFYVCDFDSFKTHKDWYVTFRQIKTMAEEGLDLADGFLLNQPILNQHQ